MRMKLFLFYTFFLVFFIFFDTQIYGFSWDDFLLNRDKQGEKALLAGNAKKAESFFQSHSWRAVAAYQAREYQKAYRLFLQDGRADTFYNQGNTLAHLGQYQKAIEAYEAALKTDPNCRDAAYNEALIQRILQEKKQDSKNGMENHQASFLPSKAASDKTSQQPTPPEDMTKAGMNNNRASTTPSEQANNPVRSNHPFSEKKVMPASEDKKGRSKNPSDMQAVDEAWLNGIAEDPGGLLKQKFLQAHEKTSVPAREEAKP